MSAPHTPAVRAAVYGALGPLEDADLPALREVCRSLHLTTRVSVAARLKGHPAIQVFAPEHGGILLATFATAADAVSWLQPGRSA